MDQCKVNEVSQEMILKELRTYFFVGGLPVCVGTYSSTGSMSQVFDVQSEIIDSYQDDFSKYSKHVDSIVLNTVLKRCAQNVGEQTKYLRLNEGGSSKQNKQALELLQRAKLLHKIPSCEPGGLPLGGLANQKKFKISFIDIGFMQRMCRVLVDIEYKQENLLAIYRGKLAEQFSHRNYWLGTAMSSILGQERKREVVQKSIF